MQNSLIDQNSKNEKYWQRTEELYRLALDGAGVGTFDYYPQTGRLDWSAKTKELFGVSPDATINFDLFLSALHPDDKERTYQISQQLLQPEFGTEYENEYRVIGPHTGVQRWVRAKGKITFDSDGNAIRLTGIMQDITKRKMAEEALRESEERYRQQFYELENVYRNAPIGLALIGKDGRYLRINERLAAMNGLSVEAHIGKTFRDIIPQVADQGEALLEKVLKGKVLINEEITGETISDPGVQYIFNESWYPVINDKNEVIAVSVVVEDITERKRAVAILKESECRLEALVQERTKELQRSNEDLQQFAHVASHDLKEPVRKVLTFGIRLKEEFGSALPEKAQVYLNKIESSATRMNSMIDGVLLYSSLNALEQTREPIDMQGLLQTIITDLEVPIAQKNAEIRTDELSNLTGNVILIYQLFYNLLNNALKFSRPGEQPVITITQQKASLDELSHHLLDFSQAYTKITVQDNGIGFGNEDNLRIFTAFTRLHPKDRFDGTGLGLSLCKKIVERHAGAIWAKGEPGQGAAFQILLPV